MHASNVRFTYIIRIPSHYIQLTNQSSDVCCASLKYSLNAVESKMSELHR